MTRTTKIAVSLGLCFALSVLLLPEATWAQKKKAIGTGKAAGIGALVGFALGGDPLWGAAGGAALGAAGGMIANTVTEGKQEKKAAAEAQRVAEQDTEVAVRDQRIADLERELLEAQQAREEAQSAIIAAVGSDVWEGYKSLRGCQHERAYALAKVGAISQDPYHRLGGLWLEAMTAVDQNDRQKADIYFQTLAEKDPEIDTVQQASLATDQAVLDMRTERAEIGIGPCR